MWYDQLQSVVYDTFSTIVLISLYSVFCKFEFDPPSSIVYSYSLHCEVAAKYASLGSLSEFARSTA